MEAGIRHVAPSCMSVRRRTGYDVSSLVVGCMLPELFVALPMVQLSMTKKAVFFKKYWKGKDDQSDD